MQGSSVPLPGTVVNDLQQPRHWLPMPLSTAAAPCRSSVRAAAMQRGDQQQVQQEQPLSPAEKMKQYQQAFERIKAATGAHLC